MPVLLLAVSQLLLITRLNNIHGCRRGKDGTGWGVAAQLRTDAPNTVRLVLRLTDAVLLMEVY